MAQVVVVVDNDDAIREVARALFEHVGYTVAEAVNGAEAVDVLRQCAVPAVVLLDVVMPYATGVDVLRIARDDARLRRHAYIVWTASRMPVPAELLDALNAPLMFKPFDIDALLAEVARAAERLADTDGTDGAASAEQDG